MGLVKIAIDQTKPFEILYLFLNFDSRIPSEIKQFDLARKS